MDISNKKVHFLGDSITEGGAATTQESAFVGLFKKAYPNAEITNYGVGGTRIAKVSQAAPSEKFWHDFDFNSRVKDMTKNADLIVVFGGTNDYGYGMAKMGEFGMKDEYTFYGATYSLYEKLLVKYPNARILVLTPLHRLGEEQANAQGKVLKDYVHAIKEVAEYFAFPVLDLYSVSGINPAVANIQKQMMPDGLHPNNVGHQRLFEVMDSFIKYQL